MFDWPCPPPCPVQDFELRFLSDYVTRAQLGDKLMSMHMQVGWALDAFLAHFQLERSAKAWHRWTYLHRSAS